MVLCVQPRDFSPETIILPVWPGVWFIRLSGCSGRVVVFFVEVPEVEAVG